MNRETKEKINEVTAEVLRLARVEIAKLKIENCQLRDENKELRDENKELKAEIEVIRNENDIKLGSGTELAKAMSRMINVMCTDEPKAFISQMAREHRTLQQNFTRLLIAWLKELKFIKENEHTDPRNFDSTEFAVDVLKKCKDKLHLPFV